MDINYFDTQHMATNTINHHQIVDLTNLEKDDIPELLDNDTGKKTQENIEQYIQYKDELETIPEESDEDFPAMAQGDGDDGDTIPYIQGDSEDEQFNTAIDDTSDDPMIVMGKPLTTAFVSVNVHISTEQVGCLQVTNHRRELCTLIQLKLIYAIFRQSGQYSLSSHVKSSQQVVNNYYDNRPTDVMSELEQHASIIMKAMYDSINNEYSDSISDDIDRVSGAVDSEYDANDSDKD